MVVLLASSQNLPTRPLLLTWEAIINEEWERECTKPRELCRVPAVDSYLLSGTTPVM